MPRLIAARRPPDAAAWGSYPTLAANVTSEAAGGYNVMVAPFADFAFRGIVFLGGPKTVAADAGAGYAERIPALAASWRATFGGTPAFFYVLPAPDLAAKVAPPNGIAPPTTAIPLESWDEAVAIGRVLETISAAAGR